jgi:hypothetical protein
MNLADLPQAERDAIEADKLAWFKAYKMLTTMTRSQIVAALDRMDDSTDMRRRLNAMKGKYSK